MEKRKLLLLKYFLNNCNTGYKVLDTKKVLSVIKQYKNNFKLLEEDIEYFKQMQFIDLKYLDNENLCLCIKDNSRIIQENLKVEKFSKRQLLLCLLISIGVSGIMSFIGAFFAILIIR